MELNPEWLKPSAIPLTIVCGPPCAGKTSYVREHKQVGDRIIDLDLIRMQLKPGYRPWGGQDWPLLERAIKLRNALLAQLAKAKSGRAWFIVGAPSASERNWWQTKLGGEIVLLNPGADECRLRAFRRGTPLAVHGIERWMAEFSA